MRLELTMKAKAGTEAPAFDTPPPSTEQREHDLEILRIYRETTNGKELRENDMTNHESETSESCAPEKLLHVINGMNQPLMSANGGSVEKKKEDLVVDEQKERLVVAENKKEPLEGKKKKTRGRLSFVSLLRTVLLDIPLAVVFALYVAFYCLSEIHDYYFLPFLDAAARTDEDLDNEYTYYDRSCTVNDLSTRNLSDLVLSNRTLPVETLVDTVLRHGGVVVPQILTPFTVQKLREHVVKRNANLEQVEKIPLSQGKNRLSFAIDASEDPIVSQALHEIATHPLLQPMMEKLLGKDPAVAEITSITNYYGCPDQTWHQDVKANGSPLKFTRTYTQSYSLFLPLQDTSANMGATDFCPGTQYCPNDGMAEICEKWGMQLSEASSEGVWKGGDGALLSQHVWHRGAKHTDKEGLERIVLVVSFLARPDLVHDRRQLSRGTYFHMRWNMWGHTWKDLLDANRFMSKPYSVVRCLGLWKLRDRNWGYDLITSAMLRLANKQDGVTSEELQIFVDTVVAKLHIPKWLQGPVTMEYDAWQIYLRETLSKCLEFLTIVNYYALLCYATLVLVTSGLTRNTSLLTKALIRMFVIYGIILVVGYQILNRVVKSQVASDLQMNRLLMTAFPVESRDDHLIPSGPMAIPERDDVLVGTRFDAKFLGGYDRWLNYHPGNTLYGAAVAHSAEYYENYAGLPKVFANQLVSDIISLMTRRGRFLYQDYRSGVWRVMSDKEVRDHVRMSLLVENSSLLAILNKEVAYMLADYRFGLKRGTALARHSQAQLLQWRNDVFFSTNQQKLLVPLVASSQPAFSIQSHLPEFTSRGRRRQDVMPTTATRWISFPTTATDTSLEVGDLVMSYFPEDNDGNGKWYRSSIVGIKKDKFQVAFDDFGGVETLAPSRIRPLVPIEEGVAVWANYKGKGDWFKGTIVAAHPSRRVDILFDDGDLETWVPSW
jgi:hypothetical protein